MLSVVSAVDPMVHAGPPPLDALSSVPAEVAMGTSPQTAYEVDYRIAPRAESAIGYGVVERIVSAERDPLAHESRFAIVVTDGSAGPLPVLQDTGLLRFLGATEMLEEDPGLSWTHQRSGAVDAMPPLPVIAFGRAGDGPDSFALVQFSTGRWHSPEARPPVLFDRWDVSPTSNSFEDIRLDWLTASQAVPISSALADAASGLMQTSESTLVGQNELLKWTAHDWAASFNSNLHLVEQTSSASQLEHAEGLSSGAMQVSYGVPDDATLNRSRRSTETSFLVTTQPGPSGLSTLESIAEGGFVEIDVDPRSPFQTSEGIEGRSAADLPGSGEAVDLVLPDLGDCRNEGAIAGWIINHGGAVLDAEGAVLAAEGTDGGVQDATWVGSHEEGGMIAFAAMTDSSARVFNAFPSSAASTPDRAVEIDNGLGLFQAFELAGTQSQATQHVRSPRHEVGESGVPGEAGAAVSESYMSANACSSALDLSWTPMFARRLLLQGIAAPCLVRFRSALTCLLDPDR